MKEIKSKGHFVDGMDCDLERLKELSTNAETDFIGRKSINEAKIILESEQENLVTHPRGPNLNRKDPNLNFVFDGLGSYQYVDVKNLIVPRKFTPPKEKPRNFNKIAKQIDEKTIE